MAGDGDRRRIFWARWRAGRRISQIAFLAVFLLLIFATADLTGAGYDAGNVTRVPWPVEAFLDIDPLALLLVFLSTWTVPSTLLWSLIVLGTAVFLGRFFCGWVCPMGTLNHACSAFRPTLSTAARIRANRPKPGHRIKYYLLAGSLLAALCGSAIAGLFDPLSLVTRGIALTVLPVIDFVAGGFIGRMSAADSTAVQQISDRLYDGAAGLLVHHNGLLVSGGLLVSLFFVAVLIANRFHPRFWCRYLCPLGALLGLSGQRSLLVLRKDESKCTNCGKCEKACSGAASPLPGTDWQRAECDLCMNCVAVCEDDALHFAAVGGLGEQVADGPDLRKRHLATGLAAGALLVPVLRRGGVTGPEGRPDPACIRPPGAVAEEDFLARCIRCGQCMKICPNNALHPALDEAGVEGLWTPVLVPRVGYCEPTCTLCTQVCPTAAILRVSENEKTGARGAALVRIGTAFIDQGRCLPFGMATPCTVCEEFCPISPKAIRLEEVTVTVDGRSIVLKRPFVVPDRCSGCGACEFACPVHDQAAIRVSSAGESRSEHNRLLL